jgi:hypothetical protein
MESERFNILSFNMIPTVIYAMLTAFPYLGQVEMDMFGISAVLMQLVVAIRHARIHENRFGKMTNRSGFLIMINKLDLKHPSENMICIYSLNETRVDRGNNGPIDTSDLENFDVSKYFRVTFEIGDMDDASNNPS